MPDPSNGALPNPAVVTTSDIRPAPEAWIVAVVVGVGLAADC